MKKFSSALIWLTASEIIFNIAGYIIHSSVGRILGPADYGRYSIIVTMTTMIIILIGNGIPTAMSKYLAEIFETAPEKILGIKYKAIRLQAILMTGVTIVFYFASPILAWALHDATLTPLFQLSSLIIPAFAAASFYFYYFTGLHFFRLQAFLKTMRALGRIIFIISFAYFFGVSGAVSGYIAAPLFVFAIALICDIIITHRYFPHVKQLKSDVIDFSGKTILAYAWPLTLFLLFYEFILTLDLYFVKSLLQSDYQTGIYNAAITVGRIPYYLFYALTIILLPAISKTTAERNTIETESLVNKSLRLMTLILFPLVTLMIAYSTQILQLFYGSKYLEAATPMNIFTIGIGFLTAFYVLSFALNGANLVKIPMKLSFFGFLGMILLNFLLIPKWELIGAAFSTTTISFILMIAILIYTKKHFNVHIPLRTFFFSLVASLTIFSLSRLLPLGSLNFIISGIILFFGYFAILRIFGELKPSDWDPFTKLFSKIMKKYKLLILSALIFCSLAVILLVFQKNTSYDPSSKDTEEKNTNKGLTEKKSVEIPFDMPAIPEIIFPDRTCTITDYDAVGDGKFQNTKNFQSAISDCANQGGGTVVVPPGIWLTGPIRLESNINLHLEEGARILFSDTFSDYLPPVFTRFEGMELYNYSPFISAKDSVNIAITGKGELDGNGDAWLAWNDIMIRPDSETSLKKVATNKLYTMAVQGIPVEKRIFGTEKDAIQPSFISFINCENILIEGIEILNSPGWTLHPVYSSNITIKNIYINTDKRNTDGIVIDSSRNVIIENSSLNTGDDAITIKSGKDHDGWRINRPSENIIVHDIVIEDGNSGIAIGSEMSADIRNVFIYNIDIQVADFGIRFKSMRGRGGIVENIWMDNVFMRRMNFGAIQLDTKYGTPIAGYDANKLPIFRNIEIKNVECRRTKDALLLSGLPESPLENITLENISILSTRGAVIENIEDKHFTNVIVTAKGKPISIE